MCIVYTTCCSCIVCLVYVLYCFINKYVHYIYIYIVGVFFNIIFKSLFNVMWMWIEFCIYLPKTVIIIYD